ncbi:MAG TPA: glycosyltransferase [Thermoanaerobaculia bacterium]|nr:glycosyltransferase [Thermoanaerobaculia bacterium]
MSTFPSHSSALDGGGARPMALQEVMTASTGHSAPLRVGYVVKRYPRFSETFIVNEILANEAAGLPMEILSLHSPVDTHFQPGVARVRTPVRYLTSDLKAEPFWQSVSKAMQLFAGLPERLQSANSYRARTVHLALQVALHAHANGITHLHAHFASDATAVAQLAALFAGLTYSFTAHAKDIFEETVNRSDLRSKLSDASAVITVSDFNVQYLRSVFGAAASNVSRVYNGMDLENLRWQEPLQRPRRVVSVGRLVEKKGFEYLIDACAILAARNVDFECDIIGHGVLEQALQARIAERNLGSRVRLLGPQSRDEVIAGMHNAAAFVGPYVVAENGDRDGLPTVLLEAMATGTPAIATDVTGVPEIIRDGSTGLLVAQRDAEALAAAIERLLDDAHLRVRIAREARKLIESEFDSRRTSAAIRDIFFRSVAREVNA